MKRFLVQPDCQGAMIVENPQNYRQYTGRGGKPTFFSVVAGSGKGPLYPNYYRILLLVMTTRYEL